LDNISSQSITDLAITVQAASDADAAAAATAAPTDGQVAPVEAPPADVAPVDPQVASAESSLDTLAQDAMNVVGAAAQDAVATVSDATGVNDQYNPQGASMSGAEMNGDDQSLEHRHHHEMDQQAAEQYSEQGSAMDPVSYSTYSGLWGSVSPVTVAAVSSIVNSMYTQPPTMGEVTQFAFNGGCVDGRVVAVVMNRGAQTLVEATFVAWLLHVPAMHALVRFFFCFFQCFLTVLFMFFFFFLFVFGRC
jgi:hypothetical protein